MQKYQVIIIGAGLAGLALAHRLKQQGINALVLEARERLGGRIHTIERNGVTLELGATWFADKHQSLNRLIQELKLKKVPQEYGRYAIYEMVDQPPVLYPLPAQPEVTHRLKDGSMALINALASSLDSGQVQLSEKVESVAFSEGGVQIGTNEGVYKSEVLVNTLPPNLLVKSIRFTPALPEELKDLSQQTHTWMGESIKAGFFADKPFWLDKEIGTIYSQKGPITEMYDHSNEQGHAMKGFLDDRLANLSAEDRKARVYAQLLPFFGDEALAKIALVEKVWADDPLTHAPYSSEVFPHQNNGATLFRQPFFNGRLYMAGSETALSFPGYMDGAVEAAERTARQIGMKLSINANT